MVDGNSTSPEWQVHPSRTCVGSIGAFEQHSTHLPLQTDDISAAYFARIVAEELDAPLLPTIPIGTSLEHSGFRGTLTLRPETLMAVIRDLADVLEDQGFTRWVLINGHGGNFCLTPVVRDINRSDRPMKILLCSASEFCDPGIARDSSDRGREIHAGEWETSLMLAIAPELVRPGGIDMERPAEEHPLQRADLTSFGLGTFAPGGAIGWPSLATEEKGRRIVASIREGLLAHIRDRLRRLEDQPRYAGAGGIALRSMHTGDIEDAMRLTATAGWNQTREDWGWFLSRHGEGSFVAVHNGRVIGTAVAVRHSDGMGWISMVLVDPEFRRIGVGTGLTRHCLEHLTGCPSVLLDATAAGEPVYRRLGFTPCGGMRRMITQCVHGALEPRASGAEPLTPADLPAAVELDTEALGAPRPALFEHLIERAPALAWKHAREGRLTAFCLGRYGSRFAQIGPVVATEADSAAAVLSAALGAVRGRAAAVDLMDPGDDLAMLLAKLGFTEERAFVRMFRGTALERSNASAYRAAAGPELG